jgi:hypothetical protein
VCAQVTPQTLADQAQPILSQAKRLRKALDWLGAPLPASTCNALDRAANEKDPGLAARATIDALDAQCLAVVHINPESRVSVTQGPVRPILVQGDWRLFLIRVTNDAGISAELRVTSPNASTTADKSPAGMRDRWLRERVYYGRGGGGPFNGPPFRPALSGLAVEYRVIELFSRDAGRREATLSFDVGQGTQDLAFRSAINILFDCRRSYPLRLHVLDENGKPATAKFTIHDDRGQVYPAQSQRVGSDFWFQPQVYRADGETVSLPDGSYHVDYARGPEYLPGSRTLRIAGGPASLAVRLQRWIDPSGLGWWSGDHHIHAAGCAHYVDPTLGVTPADMIRHCVGEDLKVGCNLTWGPCFDFQKQFFTGAVDAVSTYPYLVRWDIEISGFGSHQSGHLCLLRLHEQIPPGGNSDTHWPTLCLNNLRWAKRQGAVCGTAHSAFGLITADQSLPQYVVPKYDGIGANEYIVDVTHEVEGPDGHPVPAVDFMATVDTPYIWELNMWYHTLNCGFRTRVSGETDFPCITDERVGLGRSYVKLDGKLDFDRWCEGIRNGRCYVSDGLSHLIDFQLGSVAVGENGSELDLDAPGTVRANVKVAALLDAKRDPRYDGLEPGDYPVWHVERARIPGTRTVPVEVVVNGQPVARQTIVADGKLRAISFDVPIARSSWVALRILGSSHTNPIFVVVGGKPIRASRRSAEWCLAGVEQCWKSKQQFIAPAEMRDAVEAYDHARETYRRIITQSDVE